MKWEYEVVEIFSNDPDYIKEELNSLSQDSWRLIACDIKEKLYIFERLMPNIPFEELKEGFDRHNLALKSYLALKGYKID